LKAGWLMENQLAESLQTYERDKMFNKKVNEKVNKLEQEVKILHAQIFELKHPSGIIGMTSYNYRQQGLCYFYSYNDQIKEVEIGHIPLLPSASYLCYQEKNVLFKLILTKDKKEKVLYYVLNKVSNDCHEISSDIFNNDVKWKILEKSKCPINQ
jgi:hypothetical protein